MGIKFFLDQISGSSYFFRLIASDIFNRMNIETIVRLAKLGAVELAQLSSHRKNQTLLSIRDGLQKSAEGILAANQTDLENADRDNLAPPLRKRLVFDQQKIDEVCQGIDSLIEIPDPVGKILAATELDQELNLYRVACPLGLIGVIFESRPDALVQIAALCLKSGNGVIMKGGSEAEQTNRVLAQVIADAGREVKIDPNWLQLLRSRADVAAMLDREKEIDLIIPRGSNEFVRWIMDHTRIPVMGHADGICHVYVDHPCNLQMALKIAVDSKTQYYAVCNSAESILVHQQIATSFLPQLKEQLDGFSVQIRGCSETAKVIACDLATDEDWRTEYLDAIVSIRVVESLQQAIEHINQYGSGHTDAIVTDDQTNAQKFLQAVDAANVFWNASTRFADGFRYGLGAEVGVSTSKLHARGPVGLDGLLTYKWQLLGSGQIVADHTGDQAKPFLHRPLSTEVSPWDA